MSMTLKLDASALQALFPEGSEARADLTRAVVIDFARKCIKKDFEGPAFKALKDEVGAEAFRAIQANKDDFGIEFIRQNGLGSFNPYLVSITEEYRKLIKSNVDSTFREILANEVHKKFLAFQLEIPDLIQPVLDRYQLPETVAKETKQMIVTALNNTLKTLG